MALPGMEEVREALVLVEQLGYHPQSHFAAALAGGPQFIGWDDGRILAADTRDLLYAISKGLSGKKLAADEMYARPERVDPDQAATIADFDIDAFARRL